MSDPVNPPAAPSSGGGGIGKAWGGLILLLVLVFSGVIAALAGQVGYVFQVMRMNAGPILGIVGAALLFMIRKK